MLTFIKTYDLTNIKRKFQLLYALNVSDIIITLFLYNTGLFEEANSLMAAMIDSNILSLGVKLLIPGALLYFLHYRIQSATISQLNKSNIILNIAILGYVIVNLMHLMWIILLPILYNIL